MTSPFRVIALISAYNEGDIISQVIGHLSENGVETYLLDHHSTDDTVERARTWLGKGLIGIETFPEDAGLPTNLSGVFAWKEILRRKERLAMELGANWYIHHDADEVRESPFPGTTLAEGLRWVDSLGYNCVDFELYNFWPTDEDWQPGVSDPRTHFKYFERPAPYDRLQRKCWRAGDSPVDLTEFGGHDVAFTARRIFPIRFVLRHYRIRSTDHGRRKIRTERIARFDSEERAHGWHVQYDELAEQTSLIRDSNTLQRFDIDEERLRLLLENERKLAGVEEGVRAVSTGAAQTEARVPGTDWPAELAVRLDSLSQFVDFVQAHPFVLDAQYLAALASAIQQSGFHCPFFGRHISPADIQIHGTNYRESLEYGGLNSRLRAVCLQLAEHTQGQPPSDVRIYAAEGVTTFARLMRGRYARFMGSEYSDDCNVGDKSFPIPVENHLRLSSSDGVFDELIVNDVFEHVPDIDRYLTELARITRPGGHLISTFSFDASSNESTIKARLTPKGIEHLTEPHPRNRIDPNGSLVFEIPGWNIISRTRAAGWSQAEIVFLISLSHGLVGGGPAGIFLLVATR